jgi:hypothetical protein
MRNKILLILLINSIILIILIAFLKRERVSFQIEAPLKPDLYITPRFSIDYIYRFYVKPGDLSFKSGDYSEAEYYYSQAIQALKNLQDFYQQKSDSNITISSKDRLIDLLLVVNNRLLLTKAAINSQETSSK